MKKSKKKIFVITGNRADYDLLFWLLNELRKNKTHFDYKLIVTGNHYSKKYGNTFKNIKKDGFSIFKSIKLKFSKDDIQNVIKNINTILLKFNTILKKNRPNLIVVLGDRYEILPVAICSMFHGIPICHLNGGENTANSFDDYIRNCITKLSYFHFPSENLYRQNIIQMGENPKRVFNTGGLSINQVKNFDLIKREKIQKDLKFKFNKRNVLITYHPETLNTKNNEKNFNIILDTLTNFKDINLYFTYPNSDPQSQKIINVLKKKKLDKLKNCNIYIFKTLGRSRYLSLMKYSDFMIGNSSSGILEAPVMNKISINIGDRQKGRIKAKSVLDCKPNHKKLKNLINKIFNQKIEFKPKKTKDGSPAKNIIKILKNIKVPSDITKDFYHN